MIFGVDPLGEFLGHWAVSLTFGSVVLRICISLLFAAVIGCERATKRHSAGVRTFMLVTLAATVAMITDIYLVDYAGSSVYVLSGAVIIAGATVSVNCVLFSSRNQIKGLTTSVALWTCAIMGLASGAGFYSVTIIGFIALLCTLNLFPAMERYLKNRSNHFEIHLELKSSSHLQDFVTTIRKLGVIIDDIELNPAYVNSGLSVYSVAVSITSGELKKYKTHEEIIEALGSLDYVYHIEEMRG
ncbi:MAG: MgtC/SapB family protein [Lachnospiraceae bacterium]|nr:MgtC/SapB family protein [Lachnospiraceae bacterium]MBR4993778.1 MgtC/SapB family protein [Lachnospiraceae bacterium]